MTPTLAMRHRFVASSYDGFRSARVDPRDHPVVLKSRGRVVRGRQLRLRSGICDTQRTPSEDSIRLALGRLTSPHSKRKISVASRSAAFLYVVPGGGHSAVFGEERDAFTK